MNNNPSGKYWLLFLCLALVAGAARADVIEPASPIIKFPATISKAGTYVVASSLIYKGTSGNAITVNADNVVIDLNEHTITNEPPATSGTTTSADGIGLDTNRANLTVRNGTINGFASGVITASGSANGLVVVENVTFNNCSNAGVNLQGDVVEVRNCRTDGCGEYGLVIDSANYATMTGNAVFNTTGGASGVANCRGIEAIANYTCTVSGNQACNNSFSTGFIGIGIFCEFGYSFAKDNMVSGWSYGLDFANGSVGKYLNNLTEDCTTPFIGGTAATGNN